MYPLTRLFAAVTWHVMAGGGLEPVFDTTPVNVTAVYGHTTVLPCTAINSESKIVRYSMYTCYSVLKGTPPAVRSSDTQKFFFRKSIFFCY